MLCHYIMPNLADMYETEGGPSSDKSNHNDVKDSLFSMVAHNKSSKTMKYVLYRHMLNTSTPDELRAKMSSDGIPDKEIERFLKAHEASESFRPDGDSSHHSNRSGRLGDIRVSIAVALGEPGVVPRSHSEVKQSFFSSLLKVPS